jgi:hypothetical protein
MGNRGSFGSRAQSPGRKRYKERKRQERDVALAALKDIGASCGNCEHREKAQFPDKGWICSLYSDFQGNVAVQLDGLCTRWKTIA